MGIIWRACSVVGYPFDVRCLSKAGLLLVLLGGVSNATGHLDYFGMADFTQQTLVLRYRGQVCYAGDDNDIGGN